MLQALSQIIDPDFGMDIVKCGFVKDLTVNQQSGQVKFRLELTTPACPIKDEFERKALSVVEALDWVQHVDVKMDAVPPRPIQSEQDRPQGLRHVAHVIAVSSCKGGMHGVQLLELSSIRLLSCMLFMSCVSLAADRTCIAASWLADETLHASLNSLLIWCAHIFHTWLGPVSGLWWMHMDGSMIQHLSHSQPLPSPYQSQM